MKTKIGVLLVLAVLLGACNGNSATPAPAVEGIDLPATIAVIEAELTAVTGIEACPKGCYCLWGADGFLGSVTCPANFTATPAPVVEPTPTPEYRVVECGIRPPNGTLIAMLKPMTSRACSDRRCKNQGQVVPGSVRPLESFEVDEASAESWLQFTYLPIQGQNYNLLEWEKYEGDWQWRLVWQFVRGTEGEDFQCVEPWAE